MTMFLARSRITKSLTDLPNGASFAEAEAKLNAIKVAILCPPTMANTAAGQAAVLTAIATAMKCFGHATLILPVDAQIIRTIPLGETLAVAARALGATVTLVPFGSFTHIIGFGESNPSIPTFVQCWWDGWRSGVFSPLNAPSCGNSNNPLAGIFAGALAIRDIFATIHHSPPLLRQNGVISLWEPWAHPSSCSSGPDHAFMPDRLWLIGLGHLGQAVMWALGFMPGMGEITLQDDQTVNEENVATGLINNTNSIDLLKTRVADCWANSLGWRTRLIERRFNNDMKPTVHEAPILLSCLDSAKPRKGLARAGFKFMVDAGVGHGPFDYDGIQIRVLPNGTDPTGYWGKEPSEKNTNKLLDSAAYKSLKDLCGGYAIADASVAIPFVGAAAASLMLATSIRIASLQPTCDLLQMGLSAPALISAGRLVGPSDRGVGGTKFVL